MEAVAVVGLGGPRAYSEAVSDWVQHLGQHINTEGRDTLAARSALSLKFSQICKEKYCQAN